MGLIGKGDFDENCVCATLGMLLGWYWVPEKKKRVRKEGTFGEEIGKRLVWN